MYGGEITGNTVYYDDYHFSGGGGVNAGSGTFIKTGGIITGYADDPVNGNVVRDYSGNVQGDRGHAVYVYAYISNVSPLLRKETTVGTTTELFYTYNNNSPFWNGSWDTAGDIPSFFYTVGWSDHYTPATANGELWYSFNVTRLSTYYIWWNDSAQGDGTKTGNIKVTAQYDDGTAIFTDVDSSYTTPRAFTASKDGTVRIKVSPVTAGNTGTFGIVMRTENVRP